MKLALGTAQFGSDYGISNKTGQTQIAEVEEILRMARKGGIDMLDTAAIYGQSERTIGNLGARKFSIITKIRPLPDNISIRKIDEWVAKEITDSSVRLGVSALEGLLLHKPSDLLGKYGDAYLRALLTAKMDGRVRSIGYSIYSPDELQELCSINVPDIVQAPLSYLDRRIATSGWLSELVKLKVKVHARSVFLQGLLLMPTETLPPAFKKWEKVWKEWHCFCNQHRKKPLAMALKYVMQNPQIDRVIVGVNSTSQLNEILKAVNEGTDRISFTHLEIDDVNLLEPRRWKTQ